MTSATRTRISPRARTTILNLAADGRSVYEIVKHMNGTKMKPPGGGAWQRASVLYVLKQAGVYRPRPTPVTAPEAVDLMVQMRAQGAETPIPTIIAALTTAGLKPAHGGEWRDSTVRRILAKRALSSTRRTDAERFQRYVAVARNGCHIWTGRLHGDGYGLFEAESRNVLAHRWAYTQQHGSLNERAHLHHICRNPLCVRTAHLMPIAPELHRELEHAERAFEEAFRGGALDEEVQTMTDLEWPGMPDEGRFVGSLLAEEVPA